MNTTSDWPQPARQREAAVDHDAHTAESGDSTDRAVAVWIVPFAAALHSAVSLLLEWLAEPPALLRMRAAAFGETVDSGRMQQRALPRNDASGPRSREIHRF